MIQIKRKMFLSALILTLGMASFLVAEQPGTDTTGDRMAWWREARFGMFIHWGLYAVPAGTYDGNPVGGIGEWIMKNGRIPVARYAEYAKEFNPVKFNADDWVALAKQAGMKYIVITAKHHDGFAMYPSKVSPYNIVDATPFKRDPLAELAVACRKQGIRLGFYYSQAQDWHHPGGAGAGWDPVQKGDMLQYVRDIAAPQVAELLTNYGPDVPAVLWWDTPEGITREMADLLNEPTRARPSLIQNNRLGGGYTGDTETPEQTIPANGFPGRDWETCMTMNDTWGYTSDDQNWKPTKVLIHNLIDIASKNGNYLLNVGPTAEGVVPAPSVERLQEVGGWMRVNGEAIHGTQGIPLAAPLAWGRLTWRPGRVYAHVLDWPKDGTISLPLDRKVKRARLLANPAQEIPVQIQPNVNGGAGAVLSLPPQAPDPVATVVALELDLPVVKQAHDGSLTLMAGDSDSSPELVREAIDGGPLNIGWWVSVRSSVTWRALVERPGVYEVVLQYACMPEAGGPFVLRSGSATLQAAATPTTSWRDFREATVGQIKLDQKGEVAIEIRAAKDSNSGLMNLRALVLRPRTGWHPGDARTTTESNSEIGVHHRKP